MSRYFLADPSLISFSGHCYEYLASLAAPLERSGHQVVLLGNVAVDAVLREERAVAPCFRFWCDTRLETPERTREAHEQALRDDLLTMTREFQVNNSDVVVINTLRHWAMRGVVDWLEALPAERRPRTALILHFTAFPDPTRSEGWERFYGDAFHRIETSICRDKIVLTADSEQLVSEYSFINPGLLFHLAPVPHAKIHGNDWDTLARIKAGEKLRIGYVGEARTNKGFDLLPRLLSRAKDLRLTDLIELHIHAYCGNPCRSILPTNIERLASSCGILVLPPDGRPGIQRFSRSTGRHCAAVHHRQLPLTDLGCLRRGDGKRQDCRRAQRNLALYPVAARMEGEWLLIRSTAKISPPRRCESFASPCLTREWLLSAPPFGDTFIIRIASSNS